MFYRLDLLLTTNVFTNIASVYLSGDSWLLRFSLVTIAVCKIS